MGGPAKKKKSNRPGLVNVMGQVSRFLRSKHRNMSVFWLRYSETVSLTGQVKHSFYLFYNVDSKRTNLKITIAWESRKYQSSFCSIRYLNRYDNVSLKLLFCNSSSNTKYKSLPLRKHFFLASLICFPDSASLYN